jgi:hypothetical protein
MANVDVNRRLYGFKIGHFSEVGLLVLMFHCMVGRTSIDVVAVNANAHLGFLHDLAARLGSTQSFLLL